MKIAVIGSRSFRDFVLLEQTLDSISRISAIVSGGARGADELAVQYALARRIPTKIFQPNWRLHKRGAGHRRNELIIRESDIIIVFWDGKSAGTRHAIQFTKIIGKPIKIIQFKN